MEKKKLDFESALASLEQIIRTLESGSAPLDKSLELYEEGIGLVRLCTAELENAEKRIKILVADENGIKEENFISDENKAVKGKENKI